MRLNRLGGDWTSAFYRSRIADHLAILMAFSLPWSTTIFGVFTVLWLITLATVIDAQQFWAQLQRPACWLPVALFCLAALGMLWADAPWAARLHTVGSMVKLLALPLLMYQFERSGKGLTVFLAFLVSCTVLLALSWLSWFEPRIFLASDKIPGVPVKNYITQGVEFVLCIFGTAALAVIMWQKQRPYAAPGIRLARRRLLPQYCARSLLPDISCLASGSPADFDVAIHGMAPCARSLSRSRRCRCTRLVLRSKSATPYREAPAGIFAAQQPANIRRPSPRILDQGAHNSSAALRWSVTARARYEVCSSVTPSAKP